jgi:hypothetical protein
MYKAGDKVSKPGYGYYGEVYRMERKYRTDWAVVKWEGSAYTVQEYPSSIVLGPTRPERVTPYN